MKCPLCEVDLKQSGDSDRSEYGLVKVDLCPQCQGIWLDRGELNRLDDSVWTDVEEHRFHTVEGDHNQVTCPRCNTASVPVSPADAEELILDRCPSCQGFWLDRGELDRVRHLTGKLDGERMKKGTRVQPLLGEKGKSDTAAIITVLMCCQ